MRKNKYIIIALLCFSTVSFAKGDFYEIDQTHFSLGFLVEHAGYAKTLGMFKKVSGSFYYDEAQKKVSDIVIEIDTNSVFTNHEKRDAHLKSPDFLNVDSYPIMTFVVKNHNLDENQNRIEGELTLLGITKPIVLNLTINKIEEYPFRIGLTKPMVMGVSGSASFNRSEFGMIYGIEKGLVGDTIDLIIEFEARRQ
tara:strand:- start:984 stop:1571 length:588 start_codon:yes stop_codon:yes gene_type:complete